MRPCRWRCFEPGPARRASSKAPPRRPEPEEPYAFVLFPIFSGVLPQSDTGRASVRLRFATSAPKASPACGRRIRIGPAVDAPPEHRPTKRLTSERQYQSRSKHPGPVVETAASRRPDRRYNLRLRPLLTEHTPQTLVLPDLSNRFARDPGPIIQPRLVRLYQPLIPAAGAADHAPKRLSLVHFCRD